MEAKYQTRSREPTTDVVLSHNGASTIKGCYQGMEEAALLFSQTVRQSCATKMDDLNTELRHLMQECFQQLQCFEAEAIEARQREQVLVQQLYEARALIPEKEKEVCFLQGQITQELREQRELYREVVERDDKIVRLLKSRVGSKAQEAQKSDAGEYLNVSKPSLQNCPDRNAGSPKVARRVRVRRASSGRQFKFHVCETSGHEMVPWSIRSCVSCMSQKQNDK